MNVQKIDNLNFDIIYKVLNSSSITDVQKTKFIYNNRTQIKQIVKHTITENDFKHLMENRALQKFRPLKNSYTKIGDRMLLAKSLDISASEVPKYIKNVTKIICDINKIKTFPQGTLEKLKTYVYRHGTKDELVAFFDYELKKSSDVVKCIKNNLEYYTGGIADYFIRPIHRMSNKTFVRLFDVINMHIKNAQQQGYLTEMQSKELVKWSVVRLYMIQENSKLINAMKTYDKLK